MNRDKCRSDAAFIVYGPQAGGYRSSGGLARIWIELKEFREISEFREGLRALG